MKYCDGSKDDGKAACCGNNCPTHRPGAVFETQNGNVTRRCNCPPSNPCKHNNDGTCERRVDVHGHFVPTGGKCSSGTTDCGKGPAPPSPPHRCDCTQPGQGECCTGYDHNSFCDLKHVAKSDAAFTDGSSCSCIDNYYFGKDLHCHSKDAGNFSSHN